MINESRTKRLVAWLPLSRTFSWLRGSLVLFLATFAMSQPQSVPKDPYSDHSNLLVVIDESGTPHEIKSTQDWKTRRAHILRGMQQAMGPLPKRDHLPEFDPKQTEETKGDGYTRKTLRIVVEQGDRLPVDLYIPDGLKKGERRAAMLALHPTGKQGKRIVAGEGPRANRQYARELAQRGYVVIAPDYPSFGEYPYDFNADDYISGTMKGIFNHMRCVDYLQTLPYVDPDRIGVIGHSLGGHNAMFVGVFDERLKVIVSSCGWTPFHDYYGGKIAGWTSDRYMPRLRDVYGLDPDRVPFDFYEVVAALAPRPFFSNSPINDSNFDVNGVKKAIPLAKQIYDLYGAGEKLQVRYPPCEHDFPTEIRNDSYRFIDSALKHTPTAEINFAEELPRIAPLEPDAAIKSFEVLDGFQVQLVASEPVVTDPVALCFDERERLYVVEMRDYSEQDKESLGRIRLLTDEDRDGRYEKSTIFAQGLSWPTAIICYDGGVFVGAPPHLFYFKDTDGDGIADQKKLIFTGFGRSNVQGLMNSFRWGLDNRIHGAASSSGGKVTRPDDPQFSPVELRGRDFSFDPKKLDLRAESGGAQHGMDFDEWGRKYVCSNSNHAQFVMYDDRYIARNRYLAAPGPRVSIAADGGQGPVYRISPVEPWRIVRTRLRVAGAVRGPVEGGGRPAGYFTGSTGITIYDGNALPKDMKGCAIVGDVGSNIVHRKKLIPNGVGMIAKRIDENTEFLRSKDIWFRPVQFSNGPDGALYVLDMYREVIEHPKSLPPEIKQHLDLTSGRDRGRLWRVVPDGFTKKPRTLLSELSTQDLVAALESPNGWHRETASRLLYERHDLAAVPGLLRLVKSSPLPQGRMHALYSLAGLGKLNPESLLTALNDAHPRVREHAIKLAENYSDHANVLKCLESLTDDDDLRVRYQLAFTAGELPQKIRNRILVELFRQNGNDPWIRMACLSSLPDGAGTVLSALLADEDYLRGSTGRAVVSTLVQLIARQNDQKEIKRVQSSLNMLADKAPEAAAIVLVELARANPKLRRDLEQGDSAKLLLQVLASARTAFQDEQRADQARADAARTLELSRFDDDGERLLSALDSRVPLVIQEAALSTLGRYGDARAAGTLLDRWAELSPKIRSEAEELLFARRSWTEQLLDRLESGSLPVAEINPARLKQLATHSDKAVQERAKKLLATLGNRQRDEVIARYRPVLKQVGNIHDGRTVFRKICAACHRLENFGQELAPNLATMKNRGQDAILLNILDPNREVNPKYLSYVIVTNDGVSHTGMILSETASSVTLVRAEKKTETILRKDIDIMKSTGLSLMPEGLEKDLSPEAMADLLAYLLSIN